MVTVGRCGKSGAYAFFKRSAWAVPVSALMASVAEESCFLSGAGGSSAMRRFTSQWINDSGRIPSVEYRILLCHAMWCSRRIPEGAIMTSEATRFGKVDVKEVEMPPPSEYPMIENAFVPDHGRGEDARARRI